MTSAKRMRAALILVLIGMLFEGLCMLFTTPGTCMLFIFVGAPLVVTGLALYASYIWHQLTKRGVL